MGTSPRQPSRAVRLAVTAGVVGLVVLVALAWWRNRSLDDPATRQPGSVAGPDSARSLVLPVEVDTYVRDTSADARDFARQAERQLEGRSPGARARVGRYEGTGGSVVVVGLQVRRESDQGAALAADPAAAVRAYLRQVEVPRPRRADAGPTGGALLCGRAVGARPTTCAWGVETGLLVTLSLDGTAAFDAEATSRLFLESLVSAA